jgi:hypothetical protein
MGFATGSVTFGVRGGGYAKSIQVLDLIEYLTFDLENREIHVFGDFLARNVSERPAQLRVAYRGNVGFEDATADWLDDEYCTRPLLDIAGKHMNLVAEDGEIIKYPYSTMPPAPLKVELLSGRRGGLEPWGPKRPERGHVPFTGFHTPIIDPGKCCLYRVAGTIANESYEHLMAGSEGKGPIIIAGGNPLGFQIMNDAYFLHSPEPSKFKKNYFPLSENWRTYLETFLGFMDNYYAWPDFHHFFIEFADGRPVEVSSKTPDIEKEAWNVNVGDRKVTWVCSHCDFDKYAEEYGPRLEIRGVDQAAKHSK